VFHRPIIGNQLLDARKAFRPLRPIVHHHAPSVPRTPTTFCSRLHSVGCAIALIVAWFRDERRPFGCWQERPEVAGP
jgi:hypothetical protein